MNPEFQRHLYLEFSNSRLVGLPAFLLVVFSLTFLIDEKTLSEATANTAIGLYIVIVLFWGSKQAGESIYEELRNNTWDIQRTSAISPWSLAWGKLIGSTLYNWYGGLLCLLVYTLATPEPEYIGLTWFYSIACGLLAQGLSLLIALFALRRKQLMLFRNHGHTPTMITTRNDRYWTLYNTDSLVSKLTSFCRTVT